MALGRARRAWSRKRNLPHHLVGNAGDTVRCWFCKPSYRLQPDPSISFRRDFSHSGLGESAGSENLRAFSKKNRLYDNWQHSQPKNMAHLIGSVRSEHVGRFVWFQDVLWLDLQWSDWYRSSTDPAMLHNTRQISVSRMWCAKFGQPRWQKLRTFI